MPVGPRLRAYRQSPRRCDPGRSMRVMRWARRKTEAVSLERPACSPVGHTNRTSVSELLHHARLSVALACSIKHPPTNEGRRHDPPADLLALSVPQASSETPFPLRGRSTTTQCPDWLTRQCLQRIVRREPEAGRLECRMDWDCRRMLKTFAKFRCRVRRCWKRGGRCGQAPPPLARRRDRRPATTAAFRPARGRMCARSMIRRQGIAFAQSLTTQLRTGPRPTRTETEPP